MVVFNNHCTIKHLMGFHRCSPPGELPPYFWRQGGNHNGCLWQPLYHKTSDEFPSVFAKQNGRPGIVPAKRGTTMVASSNHCTIARRKKQILRFFSRSLPYFFRFHLCSAIFCPSEIFFEKTLDIPPTVRYNSQRCRER